MPTVAVSGGVAVVNAGGVCGEATLAVVAMLFITIFGAALAALGSRGARGKQEGIAPGRLVIAQDDQNWRMPLGFLGLCVPPTLFAWFTLIGHRTLGVDLDPDMQIWIGLIGFPLSAGLGGLLAWVAGMFRAPNWIPSNDRISAVSPNNVAVPFWFIFPWNIR